MKPCLTHAVVALAALAGGSAAAQDAPEAPAPAAGPAKSSIAVLPFRYNQDVVRRSGEGGDLGLAVKQFETSALTNKFVTALVQARKFDVLERQRIDDLLAEMQMGQDGLMDPARAVKAGKVIGADYFLTGEISLFNVSVTWRRIPNTTRFNRELVARIVVDMRIIDARTSKIVAAERGEARTGSRTLHTSQVPFEFPPEAVDALQRELCQTLVVRTIDAVYPVRVIGFSGGVVTLNRGEGGGLEPGQLLDVFSEGQELVDPDTGESLGAEEVRLGRVRVVEVLPRFSKAVPEGEQVMFPNGAVCRKVQPDPAAAPAPGGAPGPRW